MRCKMYSFLLRCSVEMADPAEHSIVVTDSKRKRNEGQK